MNNRMKITDSECEISILIILIVTVFMVIHCKHTQIKYTQTKNKRSHSIYNLLVLEIRIETIQ